MAGHDLEHTPGGYRCRACTWAWARRPASPCPGIPRHAGWDALPPWLRTKTMLRAAGLRPGGPVRGCIRHATGYHRLYDAREGIPRSRATPAQLAALTRGRATLDARRRTCIRCGRLSDSASRDGVCDGCWASDLQAQEEAESAQRVGDRAAAIGWARGILARADWCALDCETTGLNDDAEPVQLAVLDPDGTTILDTLVRPAAPIPPAATAIHGLTDAVVAIAPTFAAIYPALCTALRGRRVVAYRAPFDRRVLESACARAGLPPPTVAGWDCAMEAYARYCGNWSAHLGDYRWHPLPGGDHTATGDCRATLALVMAMAGSIG